MLFSNKHHDKHHHCHHEEDEPISNSNNIVENGRDVSQSDNEKYHIFGKCGRFALPEDVVLAIVNSVRIVSTLGILPKSEEIPSSDMSCQPVISRPRKVSEADQDLPSAHSAFCKTDNSDDCSEAYSREISCFLDLTKRDENGSFPVISCDSCMPTMLHASISNEAILRDAAMIMSNKLVQQFQERSLRMFFGYKTTTISCHRLAHLMAGFLFDASHAMFAWDQTEKELLAQTPDLLDPDAAIRKALFNQRALKKLGGFKSHAILPQAISIGRLRRRNVSWEKFATTAQGQQMLEHHRKEVSTIAAGKHRRGQRLRQRHWLTSAILWHDNEEVSIGTAPRSRSCSLSSETDVALDESFAKEGIVDFDLTRQKSRILLDMPGSKSIVLVKGSSAISWGVGLVQEGSACVVGRADAQGDGRTKKSHLQCGDMILYVQNEHGKEAGSPLCSWSGSRPKGEDWFQRMVDLFKNSTELHLVIQRV